MQCIHKGIDYKNKIVGCYEVLDFDSIKTFPSGQKQQHWKVRCVNCGNEKILSYTKIIGEYQNGCSSCVKDRFSGPDSFNWKIPEVQNVTSMYYHKLKKCAEKRKLVFDVSREYLDEIFIKQNKKCVYTGYDLYFGNSKIRGTASLDRIDSTQGYVKNNIQWVHKDVNTIKWDLSHNKFVEICKLITENFKND